MRSSYPPRLARPTTRCHDTRGIAEALVVLCLFLGMAAILQVCSCGPASIPPCTGHEAWPDPCASHALDGGRR